MRQCGDAYASIVSKYRWVSSYFIFNSGLGPRTRSVLPQMCASRSPCGQFDGVLDHCQWLLYFLFYTTLKALHERREVCLYCEIAFQTKLPPLCNVLGLPSMGHLLSLTKMSLLLHAGKPTFSSKLCLTVN